MLVYEKKVEEARNIFMSEKNIPTEEDVKATFRDASGAEIELDEKAQLRDDGRGGMVFAGSNAPVTTWAGDTPVIPQPDPTIPADAKACRIGEVEYETLEEAVAAAVDGDEIVLQKSSKGAGIALWKNSPKSITINLNGFAYRAIGPAVGSTGTQTQALHLEKGSRVVVKNGTFTADPASVSQVKMLVQNYCDLTLDHVTLLGTVDTGYVMSNNSGKVNISNSAISSVNEGVAFDVCWAPKKGYPEGTQVVIDDASTINGTIEFDLWGADVDTGVLSTLTTASGKFDELMKCTTAGYEIVKSGNVYKMEKVVVPNTEQPVEE